jgi:hypothetical protein
MDKLKSILSKKKQQTKEAVGDRKWVKRAEREELERPKPAVRCILAPSGARGQAMQSRIAAVASLCLSGASSPRLHVQQTSCPGPHCLPERWLQALAQVGIIASELHTSRFHACRRQRGYRSRLRSQRPGPHLLQRSRPPRPHPLESCLTPKSSGASGGWASLQRSLERIQTSGERA